MILDGRSLSLEGIQEELSGPSQLSIAKSAVALVQRSRSTVEQVLESGDIVYGVNTGFGKLANERISSENLLQLQTNLLRSHAAGVGNYLPESTVRLVLLLKINSLLRGYSGIRLSVIESLIDLYNKNLIPAIRERGSVGASGDLAPLADLALPLIGEGQLLTAAGKAVPAGPELEKQGFDPIQLKEKEGLSLINGTQLSTALAIQALQDVKTLFYTVSAAGAFSTEVMLGTDAAFREEIQVARNQAGQTHAGKLLYHLMQQSGFREAHLNCDRVQDFYSIRCMPQVHGSLCDLIIYTEQILMREANSTTDNPVTLIDENIVVSGGNFHAAPIAHVLDFLAIALTDVASMSERRIAAFQETSQSNLPMFLARDAGLNSGFMIAHVSAAALASDNKHLAHPASIDSIPTSANQEDHVSMAPNAAYKLQQVIRNTSDIVAIELLCACQGRDFNPKYSLAKNSGDIYDLIRQTIPEFEVDTQLSAYITSISEMILSGEIDRIVQNNIREMK
ncbi:MAG: histidine ammonia-lyase [Candidatus Marinimicrobia bacterium]|nr:histidine ammonia-lyase [Candidatus Neomarinimicrobiota bacterium]MCF7850978.1 histidine ammonia-lyase [Candidatus Neomarinimicrobiota bacterium]MCF7905131.1 histidine ammonia-lyase [Candidatus Neomarinimicrobiota bacterium]